jgi:hypothetical protein
MAEIITLTTPVTTPNVTTWRVVFLGLDWESATISMGLRGSGGEKLNHAYTGPNATTLMIALNKANLTSNSLHRRILTQLHTDGIVVGTISGSPD